MGERVQISLPARLGKKLEEWTRRTSQAKEVVIVQALEEHLKNRHEPDLRKEARRQSLLAKEEDLPSEVDMWESTGDSGGWVSQ